jgi:DNA-binding NtrC family response regulator
METLSPSQTKLKKLRILIAEDDTTQRTIWSQVLRLVDETAEVYWADSYEAVAKTFEDTKTLVESFDLLISDIFLNGSATGFDICKDYFHKFNGQVILVSSFGEIDVPKPLAENFRRKEPIYLKKPLNVPQAVLILKKILPNHA